MALLKNLSSTRHDQGFTLIELLVVIIIIGILAGVAVPIYLNQQKTARDSATTSDVKNLANAAQAELVRYPDASYFYLTNADASSSQATLVVGSSTVNISKTPGTVLSIYGTGDNFPAYITLPQGVQREQGAFVIYGYNASGKNHTFTNGVLYISNGGGLVKK
jgi:type IV pilus assembly protein PilA